jgi:hypothetical protein
VTADANGSGLAAGAVVWIRDLAGSKGLGGEHRTLDLALTLIRGSAGRPQFCLDYTLQRRRRLAEGKIRDRLTGPHRVIRGREVGTPMRRV